MADLRGMLVSGGPIVWILIVLSVFSLMLIAVKILQLRDVLGGGEARDRAMELLGTGDRVAAAAAVQGSRSPANRIAHHALAGLAEGRRRPALDEDLEWRGNEEISAMNRHLRLLELIGMVSPLLGLLGTVLGMIQSFQELALAQGAANASVLAAGIWQALLTTAAGLIVAIPATVAATLLGARVESAGQLIEATVGRLFAIEDAKR